MATPKIFVSSTCYDLAEERAQLERFIVNYGFQPILSEYSGVYYDIDEHTHTSCINEVAHADMMVLIISGRYGGKLKGGNGESITQAEYNKARELGLPIFTFVKNDVSNAQHYYKENLRNKGKEFAEGMHHPGINKQDDAIPIFNFIESVHRSSTNNGIENYQSFTDIENHLKKQWAGLFYSFLQKRKEQDKVQEMATILDKLAGSSSKLEALVASLHDKEVGIDETKEVLRQDFIKTQTYNFFALIEDELVATVEFENDEGLMEDHALSLNMSDLVQAANVDPESKSLEEYLKQIKMFDHRGVDHDGDLVLCYFGDQGENYISRSSIGNLETMFEEGVKHSIPEMRLTALEDVYSQYI
ncbi:DUF4062 domain-containing protein [Vibrio sp. D415a]|uniref:DUF4062 domain-containing protein n=1 Tax=Vibrio TaxID=662 RepID=UPI002553C9EF|nr:MULTISPECIES: DUF4062 domain-containing protein [unclassified Vibrio]EJL6785736.1 DUF4062 domain-containing protein [Vibrio alginolyticus]MDK9726815.1 DUF4062 domain-containing protein [Vibrio sp. D415a]MDK9749294.1 DUF4062 domain-containing protein [Vibrio sp. D409a]MDK9768920.1 DUF4062 domain-containing protein [Vibrio sp. D417a]MDK9789056.1 DUF4062 domain-containing protein [Vibrio sp. D421a]